MQNIRRNTVLGSPPVLRIDREAQWPRIPREVGDGMEAVKDDVTTISNQRPERNGQSPIIYSQSSSPVHFNKNAVSLKPFAYSTSKYKDQAVQVSGLQDLSITDGVQYLLEEKAALKDHLQIQIQVNQELKKLLVASVGDELGFHYERLATDKAQLSMELDASRKQCEEKKEEIEQLTISCDVWRSKFLASRMQCEDVSKLRRFHERQQREMESAVRGLLCEHWERTEHLQLLHRSLDNLNKSLQFHEETVVNISEKRPEVTNLSQQCLTIASQLSANLLGLDSLPLSNHETISQACNTPVPTPAEKYVLQVLSDNQRPGSPTPSSVFKPRVKKTSGDLILEKQINRFHSNAVFDNVTINCCNHCKGDIHVV